MMTISSRAIAATLVSLMLATSAFAQTAATPAPAAPATSAAPAKAKPERSAASLECSKQADEKGLKGKERKEIPLANANATPPKLIRRRPTPPRRSNITLLQSAGLRRGPRPALAASFPHGDRASHVRRSFVRRCTICHKRGILELFP